MIYLGHLSDSPQHSHAVTVAFIPFTGGGTEAKKLGAAAGEGSELPLTKAGLNLGCLTPARLSLNGRVVFLLTRAPNPRYCPAPPSAFAIQSSWQGPRICFLISSQVMLMPQSRGHALRNVN